MEIKSDRRFYYSLQKETKTRQAISVSAVFGGAELFCTMLSSAGRHHDEKLWHIGFETNKG